MLCVLLLVKYLTQNVILLGPLQVAIHMLQGRDSENSKVVAKSLTAGERNKLLKALRNQHTNWKESRSDNSQILYTLLQEGLYAVHHTSLVSEYPVHSPTGRSVHCTPHSACIRISCTPSCRKVCTLYTTQHLYQNILYTLLQKGLYTVHHTVLVLEYPVRTPTGRSVHCTPHSTCIRVSCTHSYRKVCTLYTTQCLYQNILYTLL